MELLCERRTVLRSAASSKSFIVFTLGPYLAPAVVARRALMRFGPGGTQLNTRKGVKSDCSWRKRDGDS